MAKQNPYDPFGYDTTDGFPDPNAYAGNGTTGLPEPPRQGPAGPAAPPTAPSPFDRTAFRDKWMGSSGSFDDFVKQNPEFSGVQKVGGGKGDKYQLPSGEIMDLQIAKGLNGENAQHGWTGVGEVGSNGQISYYPPSAPAMGQFGGSGGSASAQSGSAPANFQSIMGVLQGLFPGGAYNQNIVNSRTEGAREDLARFQKYQNQNDRAALANRGLIGSGPEASAQGKLTQDIADKYQNAVRGIYNDESQNADQRMMQALGLASNMTDEQARQAIDWFNANSNRDLGMGNLDLNRTLGVGNLALGNMKATNDYNLGLANYGLNRDQLEYALEQGDIDSILKILGVRENATNTSAQGYQGR